ncbi:TetR/AcrR family transcriptional regulator [Phaeobacter gallaeciensis]|uniref:TetR/AcrR family transcriptional regulator n=2 Tax=Roseobacteraceae TaxID=2854170 RepID=A0A366X0H0_9RHOB|nr:MULTISPECIES: TetR/AcrR family transcriptional regulator [Roseobacteraceae]MBT3142047.1 TetR/AcrR family transcriptional regulator [Falsiruegeria litorea]MBT8168607.1 TetR/AcrR family transcriptional regulator [Falsiruegeria litorea]RBW53922.1 TetR/AcrR family transcriptional regulator [Phaeobacter gallaeciensis]
MPDTATILRTGRKFDQVLRGARDVFMADGFEGASVDDIARAAGVSKATLYSYFPDKRLLFMEVAQTECTLMSEKIVAMIDETKPLREVLMVTAVQVVGFLTSEFAQQVFRICVAERDRFPELGRAFYAAGPENGKERISEFLLKAVDNGELVIDDIPMAAEQFSELCKVKLWTRAVFGIQSQFSEDEIEEVARNAVDMFLARYQSMDQIAGNVELNGTKSRRC